jgi:hypothetical protein
MSESALEFFAERAAILQFEANLSRPDAEYYAVILTRRYCARMGIDEPSDHWMKSMPRAEWSDAEGKPVMKREPLIPDYRGRGL